jgi:hypothetical protein
LDGKQDTPTDTSFATLLDSTSLVEKPGDFNGELKYYIELKAPAQAPQDLSGLVEKTGDFNGDLESYIELKAPAQAPQDLSV